MELNIKDPVYCRKLLALTGIIGLPETSTAFKMGLRQALAPENPKRKRHTKMLKKLFADIKSNNGTTKIFLNDIGKHLPYEGTSQDLYHSIFISVVNYLSEASDYFGLKTIPIGRIMENENYQNWLNTFGKSLLDPVTFSVGFVEQTIRLGRMAFVLNADQKQYGPLIHLFFEERGLVVPNNMNDIQEFERNNPKLATEIYFEIAVRAVRGSNHIAYTLSYCIHREAVSNNQFKLTKTDINELRDFVIETLRFNPPIAIIGRTTNNKENVNYDGIDIKPKTHIKFNIEEYNRKASPAFIFPSSEIPNASGSKKTIASFGSYTYLPCPAAQFSIDFCSHYLMKFWEHRSWIPDLTNSIIDLEENIRLEVSGVFTTSK